MLENQAIAYHPFYCEENIYHLVAGTRLGPPEGDEARPVEVVFISNTQGQIACWEQRAGRGRPIAWDYHVIAARRVVSGWEVWDLDTALGYPLPAATWLARTFRDPTEVWPRYWPLFRVVPRARFVAEFATDRSHMRLPDGRWQRPPPKWPPPGVPGMNLPQWIDMTPGRGSGVVMDRVTLERHWGLRGR